MNVLYVAYRNPYPPDKGERIRMYHQIRQLSRTALVHLVFPADGRSSGIAPALRGLCASATSVPAPRLPLFSEVVHVVTGRPRSLGRYASRALSSAVRERVANASIDVAIVSTVHVASAMRGLDHVPAVIDLMDVYSEVWYQTAASRRPPRSWLDGLEAARLATCEYEAHRRFAEALVVSGEEADLLRQRIPDVRVTAVGNGVDLEHFRPRDTGAAVRVPTVVFVGTMDYAPNADAAAHLVRDILPRIDVPDVRCRIVGRNPGRAVRHLAEPPRVVVTGAVADVRDHLAEARVAVVPMRMGRGVQNKILEAMAMGLPVVTTPLGREGIDARPEDGLCVAEGEEGLARETTRLLADPAGAAALGRRARAFVETHHRWEDRGRELFAVLENALARRRDAVQGTV